MSKPSSIIVAFSTFLAIGLLTVNVQAQDNGDTSPSPTTITSPEMKTTTSDHVAKAVFTTKVENRAPTDTITDLSNDHNKIYFFTDLTGLAGQVVTHRWEYQGKTMAEVKFNVGGPRWRVWSSKTLLPQWTGEWRVSILDGSGNKVGEGTFNYTQATPSQN